MDLRLLQEISLFIGKHKNLVQGPGGNTSLKTGNLMALKASGTRLEAALQEDIFCQMSLDDWTNLTPKLRPSIESGFHREIKAACVVHVHSVGSLTWACRIRTQSEDDFLKKRKILVAPYLRPGDAITEFLANHPNLYDFEAVLLQNHGLITWGSNPTSALAKLMEIENILLQFAISNLGYKEETHHLDRRNISKIFTPDHAVFSESTQIEAGSFEDDVLIAIEMALAYIPSKVALSFLEENEVESLRNWEAEKYRKSLNQI
jgi:rhamnose utilization protein RhaD (predicted bifunctional aldolase and dehydrogenase)